MIKTKIVKYSRRDSTPRFEIKSTAHPCVIQIAKPKGEKAYLSVFGFDCISVAEAKHFARDCARAVQIGERLDVMTQKNNVKLTKKDIAAMNKAADAAWMELTIQG